jgi:hypothetical protein
MPPLLQPFVRPYRRMVRNTDSIIDLYDAEESISADPWIELDTDPSLNKSDTITDEVIMIFRFWIVTITNRI